MQALASVLGLGREPVKNHRRRDARVTVQDDLKSPGHIVGLGIAASTEIEEKSDSPSVGTMLQRVDANAHLLKFEVEIDCHPCETEVVSMVAPLTGTPLNAEVQVQLPLEPPVNEVMRML